MRVWPRGQRRSVDRGTHRPAIEPRKSVFPGADVVNWTEGNTVGRVSASIGPAGRGRRPWHVRTLLAWETGRSPVRPQTRGAVGEPAEAAAGKGNAAEAVAVVGGYP